jgi:hypothetical protein
MTPDERLVQYTKIVLMILTSAYIVWRVEAIVELLRSTQPHS